MRALLACLCLSLCAGAHAQDEPAADSGEREPLAPETLQALLARHAHEPQAHEVVAAALRAQQHDPGHWTALVRRARLRGLLPHLDLGARRGQGIDLRWTAADDLSAHRTTADDVTLFATLRFDLDRLLFAPEEISVAREARFARHAEQELARAVVHVYFLRKRLLLERDLRGGSSIAQQLRIEEAEAMLDAFTGGAFQRMLSHPAAWKTGASINDSVRPSPPSSS